MGTTMTGVVKGKIKFEVLSKLLAESEYKVEIDQINKNSGFILVYSKNFNRLMNVRMVSNKERDCLKSYMGDEIYKNVENIKEFSQEEVIFIKSFFEPENDVTVLSLGSDKEAEEIISSVLKVHGGFIEVNDCAEPQRTNYRVFKGKEKNLDCISDILNAIDKLKIKVQKKEVRNMERKKLKEIKEKIEKIV